MARDDFEDADQLRIGNDGIFMLTFFSKDLMTDSAELCVVCINSAHICTRILGKLDTLQ